MFSQVKQITLFTLILFMGFSLSAQEIDTVSYSEADSLQDVMIKQLELELKSVNSNVWKINREQQEKTDSLELINEEQAEQIRILAEESENLDNKLQLAELEIELNDQKLLESRMKFKRALFISIPILFIISVVLAILLFLLVQKHRSLTEFQLNALRKYTYKELEDVKAGYVDEIKRRVKKLTAKLKAISKKEKGKSIKEKGKSIKEKGSEPKTNQKAKSKKKMQ